MAGQELRPQIEGVMREGGTWQFNVTPITAVLGLRDSIDGMRNSGLNLVPGGAPHGFEVRVAHSQEDALFDRVRAYGNLSIVGTADSA